MGDREAYRLRLVARDERAATGVGYNALRDLAVGLAREEWPAGWAEIRHALLYGRAEAVALERSWADAAAGATAALIPKDRA